MSLESLKSPNKYLSVMKRFLDYLLPALILWSIVHFILFIGSFLWIPPAGPNIWIIVLLLASHFLVIISWVAFVMYSLADCSLRKFKQDSTKVMWIILIYLAGGLAAPVYYYLVGRNPR